MRVSILFFWDGQKLIEQCVALWYDFGGTKKKKLDGNPVSFQFHIWQFRKDSAKSEWFWFSVMQVPSMADCTALVQLL